jgi:hypothetical protein
MSTSAAVESGRSRNGNDEALFRRQGPEQPGGDPGYRAERQQLASIVEAVHHALSGAQVDLHAKAQYQIDDNQYEPPRQKRVGDRSRGVCPLLGFLFHHFASPRPPTSRQRRPAHGIASPESSCCHQVFIQETLVSRIVAVAVRPAQSAGSSHMHPRSH